MNYYDTAYIYHGGNSEVVLGQALSGYPRDSYYVADKFNVQANPDYKLQFREQRARLGMEYIDFYMLHGVTDLTVQAYEQCGCIPFFQEQKRLGLSGTWAFPFTVRLPARTAEEERMGFCADTVELLRLV